MRFELKVNGETREVDVEPDTPLLWVLRDELRLTGTKFGCGIAQCGACLVHVNGEPAFSCILPVQAAGDSEITTIEGISGPEADAVKTAWIKEQVPQCGYCQSGQVMAATALLRRSPKPSDEEINASLKGIVCRCATYYRIRKAVRTAAALKEG